MNPVEIRSRVEAELALWRAAAEIAASLPRSSWTLVGAQMVFLLAYEHDLPIGRTSGDVDLMMDVRALTGATQEASRTLERLGYELDRPSPDGRAHRFRRGDAVVDVLAPDGVRAQSSLLTIPPGRTIAVAGGSQALARSRQVRVLLEGREVELPCPSVLGAILIKARAVDVADDPDKHRRDLALLLAAVADPRSLRDELRETERRWLRRRRELLDPRHPAWRTIPRAEEARIALEILVR
jgi:predicted nucleotidyltransferase